VNVTDCPYTVVLADELTDVVVAAGALTCWEGLDGRSAAAEPADTSTHTPTAANATTTARPRAHTNEAPIVPLTPLVETVPPKAGSLTASSAQIQKTSDCLPGNQ
jgi:hypothetical protein